jgi:hypothetical protein
MSREFTRYAIITSVVLAFASVAIPGQTRRNLSGVVADSVSGSVIYFTNLVEREKRNMDLEKELDTNPNLGENGGLKTIPAQNQSFVNYGNSSSIDNSREGGQSLTNSEDGSLPFTYRIAEVFEDENSGKIYDGGSVTGARARGFDKLLEIVDSWELCTLSHFDTRGPLATILNYQPNEVELEKIIKHEGGGGITCNDEHIVAMRAGEYDFDNGWYTVDIKRIHVDSEISHSWEPLDMSLDGYNNGKTIWRNDSGAVDHSWDAKRRAKDNVKRNSSRKTNSKYRTGPSQ